MPYKIKTHEEDKTLASWILWLTPMLPTLLPIAGSASI